METQDHMWEEQGLRQAVLRGDCQAWRTLYDRSFDGLYACIHLRTNHDTHRTEEVVQEAWMIAVKKIRSFDPERGGFESWLRGIAAHVLKNRMRAWKRQKDLEKGRPLQEPAQAAESSSGTSELIALVLSSLSTRFQAVLQAKYKENLSVAAIAQRWGESPKAIESLLFRARMAFREGYTKMEARD